ncbi:MAG TPA: methyltransferase domain-containing protein [Candidatus Dormibacteraeota bacterium]|nr:methyltransferase domain-containing protein [Candidatus Dormibacteraeota bacterium]
MDALLDVDWAAHWRRLVEAREGTASPWSSDDRWVSRAEYFARMTLPPRDWLVEAMEPWLRPTATLIDVGAGTGRYAVPLAERLDWVTAVEPSQAMRERIPPADNVTVIGSGWMDAEPAPADLVICVHVLYGVADVMPFVEKLERSARERVFVVMRDGPASYPADALARALGTRPRQPWLRDLLLLLREAGVEPDLAMSTYQPSIRYESVADAVERCRLDLGAEWDEERGRAWLEANLRPDEDGTVVYEGHPVTSGVLHWTPRT